MWGFKVYENVDDTTLKTDDSVGTSVLSVTCAFVTAS